MNVIKRAAALFVSICMLCTVNVFASEKADFYAEGFDSYKTNAKPVGMDITGSADNRVVMCGNRNKALLVELKAETTTVTIPFSGADKCFSASMDMMLEGACGGIRIGIKDRSGSVFYPLNADENGKIKTFDGKSIGGIGNELRNLTICYDLDMNYFTVYSGGKIIVEKWKITTSLREPAAIVVNTQPDEENGGNLYVDNIRAYGGNEYRYSRVKSEFNDKEVEFVSELENADPNRILLNNTFDEEGMEYYGLTLVKKNASICIGEDNGNHYLDISKYADDDCYIEYQNSETIKKMVIEADFGSDDPGLGGMMFYIRDSVTNTGQVNETLVGLGGENLSAKGGASLGKLKKGNFVNIACAIDISKNKVSYYSNGEFIDSAALSNNNLRAVNNIRFYISGGQGNLKIDNFRIYGGTEPRDITKDVVIRKSVFGEDDAEKKYLGKTINAVNGYVGRAYIDGEILAADGATVKNDCQFVTEELYKKLTGKQPEKGFTDIDGVQYVNLIEELKNSDKKYYDDDHGVIFISDDPIEGDEAWISSASSMVSFERNSAETLKERFFDLNGADGSRHPRILATQEDFDRIKHDRSTNEYLKTTVDNLIKSAEASISLPVCEYVIPDGLRLLDTSKQVLSRVSSWAFAYKITGDTKFAERCYKELEAAASFPNWNAAKHFLDVGEMSCAFGIGYDWLYDYLDDDRKEKIAGALMKFGIKEANNAYYNKNVWWVTTNLNWNVVCNGGTLVGALAIAERDPDYIFSFMHENLRSCEILWNEVNGGGWEEGTHYWDYVMEYMSFMLSSIVNTFNDDLGLMHYKGMRLFPMYTTYLGSACGSYNFHDAVSEKVNSPWMYFFADYYNDSNITMARKYLQEKMGFASGVYDALWYNSETPQSPINLEKDKMFGGAIQAYGLHEDYNDINGGFAATHSGNTTGPHNHYDTGSFIYDVNNVRWAMDLGWEPYSNTANTDDIYRRRAEGHNVIVYNPGAEPGMTEGFGRIERTGASEKSSFVIMDNSEANSEYTSSAKRGIMLTDSRRSLIVRDEVKMTRSVDAYWFMHTPAAIKLVDNNTAILIKDGKQVKFTVSANVPIELTKMKAEPLPSSPQISQTGNTGISKIAVKFKASGNVVITAKLAPMFENAETTPMIDIPLDEWTPVDGADRGEDKPEAEIDMLYVNGKPLEGFSPDTALYRIDHVAEDPAPVFTASVPQGYEVTVEPTEDYTDGITMVTVKDPSGNHKTKTYVISFRYIGPMEDVLGYERHRFYEFKVSSAQEGNPETGAYDQNLDTRWSSNGIGEWGIADLGESREIDAVAVAFWMGSQRVFKYDIEVSDDGINWTKVLDAHESSGKSENYELAQFDKRVTARYVKFVGLANSVNLWNNVIEFAVLRKKN